MAPNWRTFMARTKSTSASAGSANAPEVAPEQGQAQQQAVITAPEADSTTVPSERAKPETLATDSSSLSAAASIVAEPGDDNSAHGAAQAQASDPGDADLLDAHPGASSVVADLHSSASPNSPAVQIYPLRAYMDEGELRRRGGDAYTVPRRHAEDLVGRKLASLVPLKE